LSRTASDGVTTGGAIDVMTAATGEMTVAETRAT
jgi:hypothetical protein